LDENVALGEELERLESVAVRSDQPLPALRESLGIPDIPPDHMDRALDAVLEHADRLLERDRPRENPDHKARFENRDRISRLWGRPHNHDAVARVELRRDTERLEDLLQARPGLGQIALAIVGEEDRERGLLEQGVLHVALWIFILEILFLHG
jgi:hypothetical protein